MRSEQAEVARLLAANGEIKQLKRRVAELEEKVFQSRLLMKKAIAALEAKTGSNKKSRGARL